MTNDDVTSAVRDYWNGHTLGKQFVRDSSIAVGSPEYFEHIRPWMNPYRFPEVMPRIDKVAKKLVGLHLLEIGCGMGFDSVEFMKRGVKVTATDLTPAAVELAKRHFAIEGLIPQHVRVANVLDLPFAENSFDAVWALGVLHHTGNTEKAIQEIRRVLKTGGSAVISHFYRRPSWMYLLSKYGRENIEFKEEDPPVTEFLTEREIISMFNGFRINEAVQDHYRALPIRRTGFKASLYTFGFRPLYNLLPLPLARPLAYKFSIIATKL